MVLAAPDLERTRRWYRDVLGLHEYREYGAEGIVTGVVLFCGGGFIELTRAHAESGPAAPSAAIWMQVTDASAEHERLAATGAVCITAVPARMPWGLIEMWIEDPDGVRIVLVEVPSGHPLRTRLDIGPGGRL